MSPKRSRTATQEREWKVLQLRAAGLTFDQIALQAGYANRGSAKKAYDRAMARSGTMDLSLEEWRTLELHRLEVMHAALWAKASRGDLGAVDRTRKLAQDRARLIGLNVAAGRMQPPEGHHGEAPDRDADVVTEDRVEALRKARAARAAERAADA